MGAGATIANNLEPLATFCCHFLVTSRLAHAYPRYATSVYDALWLSLSELQLGESDKTQLMMMGVLDA
jgi:hypothetical protein